MATKLNLQADFAPVSAQQWKDKIIADLQPFYRREDLKGLKTTVSAIAA